MFWNLFGRATRKVMALRIEICVLEFPCFSSFVVQKDPIPAHIQLSLTAINQGGCHNNLPCRLIAFTSDVHSDGANLSGEDNARIQRRTGPPPGAAWENEWDGLFRPLIVSGHASNSSAPGALGGEIEPEYILDLDIEDLMKAEVTSVSKYGQLLLDAPAAITVLDNTMIQRSGLRELPEIPRLAPGLQAARTAANKWWVSARSLPDMGANKLLVLSDGRSIYSEDISTVVWEAQGQEMQNIGYEAMQSEIPRELFVNMKVRF